ncbi:MAG: alanine--tRNA ligase [bacterium]|nr:alanine--tRNA ligase [bacterium]
MDSSKIREEFLKFFSAKGGSASGGEGHKIVPSSSLLPSDPSVLFTTAGMQQFKPYFLGEKSPYGNNVASCQKCFRTSDIEEVGDERHLTFFEMLGNFSFGGYGKEEAIKLAKEFLNSINIKIDYVTVFAGDNDVPKDEESAEIWEGLGFSEKKGTLKFCGREDNFWGPTGEEGPCGPTTEIYSQACLPDRQGIEIWNIVFNQHYRHKDKSLTKLETFGVDTGMGLERLAMVSQGKSNIFETDLFESLKSIGATYGNLKAERIVADHIKAAVFLISEGILPSNVERGYILRRILRRAIRYGNVLGLAKHGLIGLAGKVVEIYQDVYPELKLSEADILTVIQKEEEKFEKTLDEGLKQFSKGLDAFELYTTYGFPIELTLELAKEKGIKIDVEEFNKKFKEHQEISRAGAEKKFKGGLADTGEKTVKYHTANHLLLAALRQILGPEIYQKGSNITAERLRFDFNYSERLNEEQIKKIENLVNQKIKEDIAVEMLEMPKGEALKIAKVSFDPAKYGEVVKVYKIGDFSIELCGGPHIQRTGELGHFKITKEESSGAGIRRLRAILE